MLLNLREDSTTISTMIKVLQSDKSPLVTHGFKDYSSRGLIVPENDVDVCQTTPSLLVASLLVGLS